MIKINNLSKIYLTGEAQVKALDNISLEINEGEFVAIVGKSGCGKSTLLNILGGMDKPTSGEYYFEDKEVAKLKSGATAKFRNEKIGFVFQSFYLINEMNNVDNIALAMGFGGKGASARKKRAMELLQDLEMTEKAKTKPSQLSGGQQQRIAIARALANNPKLILADEPTGNLDQENGEKIMQLFENLHKKGMTVVMVTHDMDLAQRADRVIHISDGKIID